MNDISPAILDYCRANCFVMGFGNKLRPVLILNRDSNMVLCAPISKSNPSYFPILAINSQSPEDESWIHLDESIGWLKIEDLQHINGRIKILGKLPTRIIRKGLLEKLAEYRKLTYKG
jgi:hypothetical protein